MTTLPPIILGSASKTRKLLLEKLKIDFTVLSPDIDESPKEHEDAKSLSQRLALEKNLTLQQKIVQPAVIISCDQTMLMNDEIIGKPSDKSHAISIITRCSGKTAHFFTSLCVYDPSSKSIFSKTVTTEVTYKPFTAETAANYIQNEDTLNATGAIHCEGLGICLLQSIQSDDPNAVLGLPLIELCSILTLIGFKLP